MMPLILLPGLLNDPRLWRHQAGTLAATAAIHVADLTRDDSIPAMAARVLAEAPERFALAGLSMGGYVAMEVMRQAPQRVSRLALLDTTARPDAPEQTERRRSLIALAEAGRFNDVLAALLPNLVHPDRRGDQRLMATLHAMADAVGPEAFVRQQKAIMARADSRPDLSGFACPALVLAGRQDGLTPPAVMEEIARAIPGAAFVVVEECGHMAPLEQPQAVSAVLSYWLQTSGRDTDRT